MRLWFLCFLLTTLLSADDLVAPLGSDRLVVSAYYPNDAALSRLLEERAAWTLNRAAGFVVLDLSEAEMEDLAQQGFVLEVDWDATDLYQQPLMPLADQQAGIPGFPCYLTLDETYAQAAQWASDYADLAEWVDFGDSWEKQQNPAAGSDLRLLLLTNKAIAGPKPAIFIMSFVHAREYAPAGINYRLASQLLSGYGSDPTITWLLDHHEFHLVLQANPDGRRQAETGELWRKNTDNLFCSDTNLRGVDLNRNFAFQWGCCNGSSGDECSEVFRGPSAASEPEIQAIQDYVLQLFPDQRDDDPSAPAPLDATGIFVDLHSAAGLVMWPYGFTSMEVPNAASFRPLGRKLSFFNGYNPIPIADLTIADGSTADFVYGELGVAAFAYEVGDTFFEPCDAFEGQVGPDNIASLIYLARHARAPYLSASGPDPLYLQADTSTPGSLVLSARLDDTRYGHEGGSEPTHPIAAAQAFIDLAPWEPGAVALPLVPLDGSFNSPLEDVGATLDLSGLEIGRHIVYITGTDSSGATGAPDAIFFTVERLSYEEMLAQWPNGITVLQLVDALN